MKLSKALEGFRLYQATSGKSDATISLYRTYLDRLTEYLGDPELKTITENDLLRFYAYMQKDYKPRRLSGNTEPLSRSAIQKIWTAIRSFYKWAEVELTIKWQDKRLPFVNDPKGEVKPFTKAEVEALLNACIKTKTILGHYQKRKTGLRDYALFLFMLDTGMRVSEVCRLEKKDVDLETGEVHIKRFGSGRKTKARILRIGDRTRRAIWVYQASGSDKCPSLFLSIHNMPMNRNSVKCVLKQELQSFFVNLANSPINIPVKPAPNYLNPESEYR